MDMTSVYAPITKSYEQDDGSVIVEGIITDGNLDLDQQRCDPIWLKTAVPQWMEFGNLREQHQKDRAIGRAFEHRDLGDAGHFIRGRVVDSEAVKKVKGGVFNGFSIGVKDYHLSKSADAPNGLIDGGRICEVSLVDFPCNENCRLTMVKSAKPGMKMRASDFDSERMLVRVEEFMEKSVSPELKKAAESMTVTLADALSPEQAATLAGKVTEEIAARGDEELIPVGHGVIDKTTSVDHLDAPAPGQVCVTCGNAGHLACGDSLSAAFEQIGNELADGFDRDAAIELVTKTVANADAGLGQDEMPDINGALQAIQIIAGLIQREAQALGTTPAQGCDIDLLMQAVHALRCFNRREAQEQAGINPIELAASADATKNVKESTMDKQLANVVADEVEKTVEVAEDEPQLKIDGDAEKAVEAINETREAIKTAADAAVEIVQEDEASDVDKTAAPEAIKATTVEPDVDAITKAISAALEKAFSTEEMEKEDNPLRKTLGAVVSAATESVAKSVSDLTERLEMVEQMATPGGPAQRARTDAAVRNTERTELLAKARYYRDRSENAHDLDLRKGYATYAAEFQAKADALGA